MTTPPRSDEHFDHVFPVAEGITWHVRAYYFADKEKARREWERIEEASLGKGNFSIWRSAVPDEEGHYIVLCGRPEHLPVVVGGTLHNLDSHNARHFAARRFRTGAEAFEKAPEAERFDHRARYGEEDPMVIDSEGNARPYRQR